MADIKSETLALAALLQCSQQIERVAYTGYFDEHAVAGLLRAVLVTNPRTVEDIYNPGFLLTGFKQLVESLGSQTTDKTAQNLEITRNAFKLISLELDVEHNKNVFNRLGSEIDRLKTLIADTQKGFMDADPQVVITQANLTEFSNLYQSLISPNFSKLIIYGEERFLSQPENQLRIRALLLAGIRAVVLWRQCGGRRRFLVFRRKAIVECARRGAATGQLN
ncbi:MAG: lysogenization regulator HflD [Succinivibrio sp.]|nr:lysogenization regulator HflD [Succinivibrio sp.]